MSCEDRLEALRSRVKALEDLILDVSYDETHIGKVLDGPVLVTGRVLYKGCTFR